MSGRRGQQPYAWNAVTILAAIQDFYLTYECWPRAQHFLPAYGLPTPATLQQWWSGQAEARWYAFWGLAMWECPEQWTLCESPY